MSNNSELLEYQKQRLCVVNLRLPSVKMVLKIQINWEMRKDKMNDQKGDMEEEADSDHHLLKKEPESKGM